LNQDNSLLWGHPKFCRLFGSLPSLYSKSTSSTCAALMIQNVSRHSPNVSWGNSCPQLRILDSSFFWPLFPHLQISRQDSFKCYH
jgi:hypothetical protein